MLKKRNAQGLSINLIVLTVIGLVVLVVIIAIFTGRINVFSSGVDELTSCENSCNNIGADDNEARIEGFCTSGPIYSKKVLPGTFSDIKEGWECCCRWRK